MKTFALIIALFMNSFAFAENVDFHAAAGKFQIDSQMGICEPLVTIQIWDNPQHATNPLFSGFNIVGHFRPLIAGFSIETRQPDGSFKSETKPDGYCMDCRHTIDSVTFVSERSFIYSHRDFGKSRENRCLYTR